MSTFKLSPIFSCDSYSNLSLSAIMVSYSFLHPPDPVFCPSLSSILSCLPFYSILSVSLSCLLFYFINNRTFPLILLLRDHVYSTHPLIASSFTVLYPAPWALPLSLFYSINSSSMIIAPGSVFYSILYLAPWSLHLTVSSIIFYSSLWSLHLKVSSVIFYPAPLLVSIHHLIWSSILIYPPHDLFFSVLLYSCESWFPL